MPSVSKIEKQLVDLKNKEAQLRKELKEAQSRMYIDCRGTIFEKGCGKKTQIKNITYIQAHVYIEPYSCTEGDYWKFYEGRFICPKCGALNILYDRREWEELRESFKNIENVYE